MKSENLKKGLRLFAFFFKIGCFTFGGGWSILAQMEQEFVEKEGLITKEELLEMAAVGKSVPGIMITNISMLFGYQLCGWFGGVCSVLGITCPAVLILTAVSWGYESFKSNYWCHCALRGIQAAVVPIIGSAALSLGRDVFATTKGKAIGIAAFLLCVFTGISNIWLVLLGIAAALLTEGVRRHGLS
ncbi:MAG: chromate transporter [Eubacteriales bacterium]|nr:chromate transporter [Eubacteriales bacterium]